MIHKGKETGCKLAMQFFIALLAFPVFTVLAGEYYVFPAKREIKPMVDCTTVTDPVDIVICNNPDIAEKDYYFYKLYSIVHGLAGMVGERSSPEYYDKRKQALVRQTVSYSEEGACDDECFEFYASQESVSELGFMYAAAINELISSIENPAAINTVKQDMLSLWGILELPTDPVDRFFFKKQREIELDNLASADCVIASYTQLARKGAKLIYQSSGSFCRGAGSGTNVVLACYRGSDYYDVNGADISIDEWRLDEYGDFENEVAKLLTKPDCPERVQTDSN